MNLEQLANKLEPIIHPKDYFCYFSDFKGGYELKRVGKSRTVPIKQKLEWYQKTNPEVLINLENKVGEYNSIIRETKEKITQGKLKGNFENERFVPEEKNTGGLYLDQYVGKSSQYITLAFLSSAIISVCALSALNKIIKQNCVDEFNQTFANLAYGAGVYINYIFNRVEFAALKELDKVGIINLPSKEVKQFNKIIDKEAEIYRLLVYEDDLRIVC